MASTSRTPYAVWGNLEHQSGFIIYRDRTVHIIRITETSQTQQLFVDDPIYHMSFSYGYLLSTGVHIFLTSTDLAPGWIEDLQKGAILGDFDITDENYWGYRNISQEVYLPDRPREERSTHIYSDDATAPEEWTTTITGENAITQLKKKLEWLR